MTAQAADLVWGYPELRSEASGHCLTRALGQDRGDKRLWAGLVRGLKSKMGDKDTARLLASGSSKQRATTSVTLAPSPSPAPRGGDGRAPVWLSVRQAQTTTRDQNHRRGFRATPERHSCFCIHLLAPFQVQTC